MSATVADVLAGRARWAVELGDCRDGLRALPDGCAQTCVTSPPYYGLRDYGNAAQIGLEASPREYVEAMVAVMREVRRVLADDGTLWLNLGDSYASDTKGSGGMMSKQPTNAGSVYASRKFNHDAKPKDLLGIPWRVAFALQDDGWYLRSDIVWAKPNPMPESVTDRPTRAHEYVFLLTKRARYFYDGAAIREPVSASTAADSRIGTDRQRNYDESAAAFGSGTSASRRNATNAVGSLDGRNARDVWTISPEPFAEAHFATMPPALARRCVRAGSRKGDVVLDPFNGAGTSALVSLQEGRRYVGCELNADYAAITARRLADFDADTSSPIAAVGADFGPLFGCAR